MSLLESDLADREWIRVGDCYEVTKKPRDLDRFAVSEIPFAAMDAIPQDGTYSATFTAKAPKAIARGTYFQRGDVLVAKITPSFENGKQALAIDLPAPFGYTTTEVIPLHPREPFHDPRLLFFYLLHPDVRHHVAERMEGTTGRQRVPENVLLDLPIPAFDADEQAGIADALEAVRRASATERKSGRATHELKRAAMRELFTRGLRGEAQKETEIGPLPESWSVVEFGSVREWLQYRTSVRCTYERTEGVSGGLLMHPSRNRTAWHRPGRPRKETRGCAAQELVLGPRGARTGGPGMTASDRRAGSTAMPHRHRVDV
jgi:type I restriction enzyme S subunit